MPKPIEKLLLLTVDFITIQLAFWGLLQLRTSLHLFAVPGGLMQLQVSLVIYVYWLLLFLFFGLYQSWYTQSRFDETISVFKAIAFGTLLILLLTAEPERDLSQPPTIGRLMILSYFALMVFCVASGRLILHTAQRKLLQAGVGQRNTLIIGWNGKSKRLADKIKQFPALGYRVVGFITLKPEETGKTHNGLSVLGSLDDLGRLVRRQKVEEVILSLGQLPQKRVMHVIGLCDEQPVHIKIEPELYHVVMGQARTQQIYGFPLIEINPQIMPAWERRVKRMLDIVFAILFLLLLLPVMLITAMLIKLDSRGPVLFNQQRVGKNGKLFTIYKFRTMIKDAEKYTGPVWAEKSDPRITRMGRFMRKVRLDEFPQCINVLKGDMSLVGPRPERPYFVEKLKQEYPYYTRRLKVQPGITGWAQVKGEYDTSVENVREKLQYDLYYIENMSLRMDIRIMLYTVFVMLRFKGQ
ncbi:MAG TPA: undecaprenyl-phosphate glucose phosphotransferase [bacterium]|nr:undecaprenyl-phosphate glucose phosphotransferase [bacterium]